MQRLHSAVVQAGDGRAVAFDRAEWRRLSQDECLDPDVVWPLLDAVEAPLFAARPVKGQGDGLDDE